MSNKAGKKHIIRLPTPRQQALYEKNKAIFDAMLLETKDG